MADQIGAQPPAAHAPAPRADAPAPARQGSIGGLSLPNLADQEIILQMGRKDRDQSRLMLDFDFANQDAISQLVFNLLENLILINSPITAARFQRVWKTIIVSRLQDIEENETGIRPNNYVRLAPLIPVPRPLADLLFMLGEHRCELDGVNYQIKAQTYPAAALPDYFTVDNNMLTEWITFMGLVAPFYEICERPRKSEFLGLPFYHLLRTTAGNNAHVSACLSDFHIPEVFMTFVFGNLTSAPPAAASCHFTATTAQNYAAVTQRYLTSYIKQRL